MKKKEFIQTETVYEQNMIYRSKRLTYTQRFIVTIYAFDIEMVKSEGEREREVVCKGGWLSKTIGIECSY